MRLLLRSRYLLCPLLGMALLLTQGCDGRYGHNAKTIEKACVEIDQKHPDGMKAMHQNIPATEWPAALLKEQPKAVEVFDGAVWVFFKRSKGETPEGYVYDAAGKPSTDAFSLERTKAPHLYYFIGRP